MMNYFPTAIIINKFISFSAKKAAKLFKYFVDIDDILSRNSERPRSLGLQVTNICNANCIFCGYKYLERTQETLPMDLFKKAIDEFDAFGGGDIGFTPIVGDPLIDPNFIERIKYARNKKNISRVGFFTNGILINQIGAQSIITSGVDEITISIGGFDAGTYSRIFRVDHWNSVYEGILNLLRENELYSNRVDVCIGLRSDISIWELLKMPAYKELKKFKFALQYNIHYDTWSGRIKQKDLKGVMRLRNRPKKIEPCSFLYTGPMILSNGDMTLCGCRDLNGDGELVLGSIRDKSILEMWREHRVDDIRKGFYLSRYPKICQDCLSYDDLSCFAREKIKDLLRNRHK